MLRCALQNQRRALYSFPILDSDNARSRRYAGAGTYDNGAGGTFRTTQTSLSNEQIALAACESKAGGGQCKTGSCGSFTYKYPTKDKQCDGSKVGYEWIYSNTGYTKVGQDYSGQGADVSGDSLFVRHKPSTTAKWLLSLKALGDRRLDTTTATTTTTTATTATATTTTTYIRQRCHGDIEAVHCGDRIPKSDCVAGGDLQQFAEENCPAMCGLKCSSTTTTVSSTTTTTTTTTTATTSTATTSTTTQTTITTFTTTTVLTLNANCNPRDDRCDAQEGLSCDPVHNECRHADAVTIPRYLQAEVDRLVAEAVTAADAAKDAEMNANALAADAAKDAAIHAKDVEIHAKELAVVTLRANLTVCNTKLEARRLVRLAQSADDVAKLEDEPCAGQSDPTECDHWTKDSCGSIMFGDMNVTGLCPVLCDSCDADASQSKTNTAADADADADAAGVSGPDASATADTNNSANLAIGVCVGIVFLATLINVVVRCRSTKHDGDGSSQVLAFVNPMYKDRPAESSAGMAAAAPPPQQAQMPANQEETYDDLQGDTDQYEGTYEELGAGTTEYMTVSEPSNQSGIDEASYGPAIDESYEDVEADFNC